MTTLLYRKRQIEEKKCHEMLMICHKICLELLQSTFNEPMKEEMF